jgi:nucleotide-binding universal stress UspA family protein
MIAPAQTRLLNILLADDGSAHSRAAVELVADLPHMPECVVTALRVFTPLQTAEQDRMEEALHITRSLLAQKGLRTNEKFLFGYPAEKILEYADEHNPDLVVMGAKGIRNALGIPLGGVAMHLVEDGRWPVLVVRAPYKGLKKVLLVTDGSPCSEIACDYLGAFPLPKETHVTLMHVLPPPTPPLVVEPFAGGTGYLMQTLTPEQQEEERIEIKEKGEAILSHASDVLEQHGIAADKHSLQGDAAEEIINYACKNEIDLIVTGSRGMGSVRGWLMGSVSRKLVHYAGCSVMVARCKTLA